MKTKIARAIRAHAAKVCKNSGVSPDTSYLINNKTGRIQLGRCERALSQNMKKRFKAARAARGQQLSHAAKKELERVARNKAAAAARVAAQLAEAPHAP